MNHPPSEDFFGIVFSHHMMMVLNLHPCLCMKLRFTVSFFIPPSGRCARCGDNVVGDGSGCIAMEQVFHVECFTCITCHARLRGQPFYALDKKSYCESCYIVSNGLILLFIYFLGESGVFFFYPSIFIMLFFSCFSEYIRALFKVL